jgi:biotin carboxylase
MKRRLRDAGVRVTDWVEIDADADPEALIAELGLPLVIKPRTSSGSRGLVMAGDAEQARAALRPFHLAERFVTGVEMSVESVRAHGATLFTNFTAYHTPLWANLVPAELDDATTGAVLDLNERALDALGVQRGICHLELFLHADGPVVGEVAIRPPGGYLMQLIELAYGFDPWETLLRVIVHDERVALPRAASASAGAFILHPGPGRVRAVHGRAAVKAWPETVELNVRVRAGSQVTARVGSGAECGHVLLRTRERAMVARRLDEIPEALRIELEPA